MKRLAWCLTLLAAPASAEEIDVPSGQPVTFVEVIHNVPGNAGLTYRFRFLAPRIAREKRLVDPEIAALDMDALCSGFALPRISGTGPAPAQIVISLSDKPTEFGVPNPDVTQFFEAYRIEDGACIWEGI